MTKQLVGFTAAAVLVAAVLIGTLGDKFGSAPHQTGQVQGVAVSVTPTSAEADPEQEALRQQLFDRLNGERARYGRDQLKDDPALATVAQERADALAAQGYSSLKLENEQAEDEKALNTLLANKGLSCEKAWAAVSHTVTTNGSIEAIVIATVQDQMDKQGIRSNILDPGYNSLGVGAAQDSSGKWYMITVFGRCPTGIL